MQLVRMLPMLTAVCGVAMWDDAANGGLGAFIPCNNTYGHKSPHGRVPMPAMCAGDLTGLALEVSRGHAGYTGLALAASRGRSPRVADTYAPEDFNTPLRSLFDVAHKPHSLVGGRSMPPPPPRAPPPSAAAAAAGAHNNLSDAPLAKSLFTPASPPPLPPRLRGTAPTAMVRLNARARAQRERYRLEDDHADSDVILDSEPEEWEWRGEEEPSVKRPKTTTGAVDATSTAASASAAPVQCLACSDNGLWQACLKSSASASASDVPRAAPKWPPTGKGGKSLGIMPPPPEEQPGHDTGAAACEHCGALPASCICGDSEGDDDAPPVPESIAAPMREAIAAHKERKAAEWWGKGADLTANDFYAALGYPTFSAAEMYRPGKPHSGVHYHGHLAMDARCVCPWLIDACPLARFRNGALNLDQATTQSRTPPPVWERPHGEL